MPRQSIELGWMNITPCTKVEWTPTSIPGISTPTVKTAEQRLTAYAEIDTDQMKEEALSAMKECAIAALAAAGGISAVTANPGAAVAAFKAAFIACFSAKYGEIAVNGVDLHTNTTCVW